MDNFFKLKSNLNDLDGGGDFSELEEDEYDALNDETFGSDAIVEDDDWENMHRLLAAEAERGKDIPAFPPPPGLQPLLAQKYPLPETSPPSGLTARDGGTSLSELLQHQTLKDNKSSSNPQGEPNWSAVMSPALSSSERSAMPKVPPGMSRIPTVEELERKLLEGRNRSPVTNARPRPAHSHSSLMNNSSTTNHIRPSQQYKPPPPGLDSPQSLRGSQFGASPMYPPRLPNFVGPRVIHPRRHLPPPHGPPMPGKGGPIYPGGPLPQHMHADMMMRGPGMGMMMGMMGRGGPPPGMYPPMMSPPFPRIGTRGEMLHYAPPHPILYPHLTPQHRPPNYNGLNWQQKQLLCRPGGSVNPKEERDEYAKLMTTRQRIWLLNIQMMQLNVDEPYIHDYYYTMWKKKHPLKVQGRRNGYHKDKDSFFANNRPNEHQRERRDSERENRVYVPLQFENSLGKIQAKSVIAPRQVFDLDVVSDTQTGSTPAAPHKDHRKTKKILLELERLYVILLKAEEIDEKEELNEEDDDDNESDVGLDDVSKEELINRLLVGLLNEERYLSFLCIRKGKVLLIRCLGHISDWTWPLLTDVWARMLRAFPTVLRRDKDDALLPRLYPYLKQWSAVASWDAILAVAKSLLGGSRDGRSSAISSTRASPCPSKPVLSYIISNKFGVSAVTRLLMQGETKTSALGSEASMQWRQFVEELVKAIATLDTLDNAIKPMEPIPQEKLTAILRQRCPHLAAPLHFTALKLLAS